MRSGTGCSARCASSRRGSSRRAGDEARFLDRLTDHYLAMAARFDEHVLDGDQPDRLRRLRAEHANLQAALAHSLDDSDSRRPGRRPASAEQVERWRRGCRLAVRLRAYWQMRGLLSEGRHYLDKALRVFPEPSPERAWALGLRGRLATFQGDLAGAVADIRESIRLAEESGQELAAARGYLYLNLALAFAGAVRAGHRGRPDRPPAADRVRRPHRPGLPGTAARPALPARREHRRGAGLLPARTGQAQRLPSPWGGSVDHQPAAADLRPRLLPAAGRRR